MYRQKRGLVDVCEGSVSAHIHDPPAYPRFGTVVVGDMRLQGRAWTVFDAHAGGHDLVAKFYVPRIGGWTRLGDVRREIWLYDHVLRGLQGTVVPRWYGVYGAQQPLKPQGGMGDMVEVYVALTKDAGVPMTGDELRELTEEDKWVPGVCHSDPAETSSWTSTALSMPSGWSTMRLASLTGSNRQGRQSPSCDWSTLVSLSFAPH